MYQNQYQLRQQNKTEHIVLWDWILIIGILLSPMNRLRVWKVGPSELLVLIWCLRYIGDIFKLTIKDIFVRYWFVTLLSISIGAAYGTMFYPKETSITGVATFIYFFFISVGICAGMRRKSYDEIWRILRTTAILISLFYMFLYVYSKLVSKVIFGYRLWYWNVRFSPVAKNPHQIAVTISSILFVNFTQIFSPRVPVRKKILPFLCTVFCVIMAMATKSSTLVVAIAITMLFYFYYKILAILPDKRQKWIASMGVVIILAVGIGVFKDYLYDMLYEWIAEDPNGLGRITIFSSFSTVLQKNWLFGLGPGNHAMDGRMEFHNAYLEIYAMGGIISFSALIAFLIRLFKRLLPRPELIFVILPVLAYGLSGFSLRRMIFWFVSAVILVLADKGRELDEKKNNPDVRPQPANSPKPEIPRPSLFRQ